MIVATGTFNSADSVPSTNGFWLSANFEIVTSSTEMSVASTCPDLATMSPRGGCSSMSRVVTAWASVLSDAPSTTWIVQRRSSSTAKSAATTTASMVRRIVRCEPVRVEAATVGVGGVATSSGGIAVAPTRRCRWASASSSRLGYDARRKRRRAVRRREARQPSALPPLGIDDHPPRLVPRKHHRMIESTGALSSSAPTAITPRARAVWSVSRPGWPIAVPSST